LVDEVEPPQTAEKEKEKELHGWLEN